jgi:hypothetical protein
MFNSAHYVPILKWKRAEQGALKTLSEDSKSHMTPLIQFVMPKPKADEQFEDLVSRFIEEVPEIPINLLDIWGRTPVFVDVSLLFTDELKAKSLELLLAGGSSAGGSFIPVMHLRDNYEIKRIACTFAKEKNNGLCLRLISSDLVDLDVLNRDLDDFLQSSGLEARQVDLAVDIKETGGDGAKYSLCLTQSQSISNLSEWRTFTFAAGSFPKDLSECKLDEENLIKRIEWNSWKEYFSSQSLLRKPTFADYTIQHPIYIETAQFFHPTSSIKYTLEDEWLIMKGRKQKFELYLASAAELIKDSRFYGENFSEGDKYIAEKAGHFETYIKDPKVKGTGSTETWLKAGINHHLVLVAHQVANLV